MIRSNLFEELTRKELFSYYGGGIFRLILQDGEVQVLWIRNKDDVNGLNSGENNISLTNE